MPPYGMPAMPQSAYGDTYGMPVGQVGFVSNVRPTGQFGFCVQCGNPKVDSNPFCGFCGHCGPSSNQLPAPEPHPTQPIRQESSVAICDTISVRDAGVSAAIQTPRPGPRPRPLLPQRRRKKLPPSSSLLSLSLLHHHRGSYGCHKFEGSKWCFGDLVRRLSPAHPKPQTRPRQRSRDRSCKNQTLAVLAVHDHLNKI